MPRKDALLVLVMLLGMTIRAQCNQIIGAHLIQDGRETSNGALAGLSMTRNIGTSNRLAVMCGFGAGHIPRGLGESFA